MGAKRLPDLGDQYMALTLIVPVTRRRHGEPAVGIIRRSRFGDVALVAFLLAQACDGVLTYVGVSTYGVRIEGNPLLAG